MHSCTIHLILKKLKLNKFFFADCLTCDESGRLEGLQGLGQMFKKTMGAYSKVAT